MVSQSGRIFVGRQQEMAVLEAALKDALSGQGRLVMLAGEPGIGKTRTAQEVAALGEQQGAQVLLGWCYEHVGAPPYWPYVQPIRTYVEQTGAQQLSAEMGPGASDIAEIVPGIRSKISGLPASPSLAPEQARFRLFDSVANFFKNAGRTLPLILVLDDLHWADASSLLMLEFLAKEIGQSPVMILGTYRDVEVSGRHPLAQTLGTLVREQHYQKVSLGGLSLQEVGEFVQNSAGMALPDDAIETVHSRTEGNPLFVSQVVGLVSPAQMVEDRSWAEVLPEGVRETIGRRLSRLSEPCNQVLRTASVIGREFDSSLLQQLSTDFSADEVLDSLDEALEARVLEPSPTGMSRHRFGHALIQQALYEELTPVQRARIHARAGEALEAFYGELPGDHAAEFAYHFAEASQVLGPEKLVRYSLLAGEQALATYAHEEALVHFQDALAAKERQPTDAEMAAALFGLGRAQAAALGRQQPDLAFASLDRAFKIYAGTNDVVGAVRVAEYSLNQWVGHRGGVEIVARALQLVPPDSQEAGRLLSRHVLGKGLGEGDYEGAAEAFDSALAISQRTGDVGLEMRTLAHSSMVDFWHLRWQGTVAKGLRVIELARRAEDQLSEVSTRFWVGITLLQTGVSKEAQRHAAAMLAPAESLRAHYWLATAFWLNELASSYQGDWQAAREFNQRGLLVSPSDTRLLGSRMLLEYETGNVVEGNGYLEGVVEALHPATSGAGYDHGAAALMIPIIARITGAVDRLHIAEGAAATVLSAETATPMITRFARWGLALIAVLRGDVELALEQYSALQSSAGIQTIGINYDRALGLVAQTMGEFEIATEHYQDALAFCRKAGYRPELAWTCHDYADALLAGPSTGSGRTDAPDLAKAISLLDEALAISTDLGMRPLMERVAGLQERAQSQPARAPSYPDGLSQREVEVLRLIATGKTDREIGEELFISIRTVGNHVRSILNKTAAANRTEATAYAVRNGLA